MEKFILIKQLKDNTIISHLCSKQIFKDDKIIFEIDNIFMDGIVKNFFDDNQCVRVQHEDKILDLKVENCFFPIIEIFDENLELDNKTELIRENLIFAKICTVCKKNSRELENCNEPISSCLKEKSKPYAFINI